MTLIKSEGLPVPDEESNVLDFLLSDRVSNCIQTVQDYCDGGGDLTSFYLDMVMYVVHDHFCNMHDYDGSPESAAIIVKIVEIRALIDEAYPPEDY